MTDFVTGGDFGGTKQRLVLFGRTNGGEILPLLRVNAQGSTVESPSELFEIYKNELLKIKCELPEKTAIGVAGPIDEDGSAVITNTGMKIDPNSLPGQVELLNDFESNAYWIPQLTINQVVSIGNEQEFNLEGNLLVIGPGTGLGVASLLYEDGSHRIKASEGGHMDYAPKSDLGWALKKHMMERGIARPTYEHVGSGVGLENIALFLAKGNLEDLVDPEKLNQRADFVEFYNSIKEELPQIQGRKMIEAYNDGKHVEILDIAMDLFVEAAAICARSNVHSDLAYSGVFIVGGNGRKLEDKFREKFANEFYSSTSHPERIKATPIYLLEKQANKLLGSYGAAQYVFEHM